MVKVFSLCGLAPLRALRETKILMCFLPLRETKNFVSLRLRLNQLPPWVIEGDVQTKNKKQTTNNKQQTTNNKQQTTNLLCTHISFIYSHLLICDIVKFICKK
jgi:hypothetical protein